MRFRVSQELNQPVGTEYSMDLRQRSLFLDDEVALSDVQGDAHLIRTDRGILVTVHARAMIKDTCSRCLGPVQSPIEIDLEEEFIPVVDPLTGKHISAAEAEDNFVIDTGLNLDLGEALRQYALISSPRKPLCRPDCAGICPRCGANLNEQRCSCRPETDARWGALAALDTKDQEGS